MVALMDLEELGAQLVQSLIFPTLLSFAPNTLVLSSLLLMLATVQRNPHHEKDLQVVARQWYQQNLGQEGPRNLSVTFCRLANKGIYHHRLPFANHARSYSRCT